MSVILFDRSEKPKLHIITRVSLSDQIAEVERELRMRKQTYFKMIDAGKMTAAEAEMRTVNMAAVLQTLEGVRGIVNLMNGGKHERVGATEENNSG